MISREQIEMLMDQATALAEELQAAGLDRQAGALRRIAQQGRRMRKARMEMHRLLDGFIAGAHPIPQSFHPEARKILEVLGPFAPPPSRPRIHDGRW